ncbi:hypothetical protein [Methylocella sp.]|uniref:hypothetical protein n=1 Tax=Methylocella sp. TaxID=1978226 RepID=UPI003784B53A
MTILGPPQQDGAAQPNVFDQFDRPAATPSWADRLHSLREALDVIPRAAANAVTFGQADRAAAVTEAGIDTLRGGQFGDAYANRLAQEQQATRDAQADHPILSTATSIAATPALPLKSLGEGAGLLGRTAGGFVTGGVLGGLQGAGQSRDFTNIPEVLDNAQTGAAWGAGLGAAFPLIGAAAEKAIAPFRSTDPARQTLVDTLGKEGVDLTAGQKTGRKSLQWAESTLSDMPFAGGKAAAMQEAQGRQFTAAALRRAGVDADLATPEVLEKAAKDFDDGFEAIGARNTIKVDQTLRSDLMRTLNEYNDALLPSQQSPLVRKIVSDVMPKGAVDGADYQSIRSKLSKMASRFAKNDSTTADALGDLRQALDDAMGRSVHPADAAEWGDLRRKWGAFKTIEDAMAGAGAQTAQGYLSPAQLRAAVAQGNKPGYVRGQDFSGLGDLARAGVGVMTPLPQSGTAPRNFFSGLLTGGPLFAGNLPGAALSLAWPAVIGRGLMSSPVQNWLANQIAPDLRLYGSRAGLFAGILAAKEKPPAGGR